MLDRDFFRRYQPLPAPFWEWVGSRSWRGLERASGTRVVFEGFDAPPTSPVIFATNSTQKYDFMPIRVELERRRIRTVTVTKGKNYHSAPMAFLMSRLGVIPLASRGYLLLVDFTALNHRRPSDAEYRALREHLDTGTALPAGAPYAALLSTPRDLLGYRFDPAVTAYRAMLQQVYAGVMGETLRLLREAVAAGSHVQIYPEGTASSRLGQGRIGTVEFAHALGLPIIPVGMSGCREAFSGAGMRLKGGVVTVRFGQPYRPDLAALPADFTPFVPEQEAKQRPVLQAATDALMQRIDALLDPAYRHLEGFTGDGTPGNPEVPLNLHPRHRIDIALSDLGFAARACVDPRADGTAIARELEEAWGEALVCQSVRSAFDLYLTALELPRGSEVITTALTIPDMVRILEDHGLVCVPVDLDPTTLGPRPEWVEAAVTPRTRAILVAHLLGGRLELAPIAAIARAHRLELIEDAAQSFAGPGWRGHREAAISMFSFGSIKTATALGGAIAVVRSPRVRAAMAAAQARWPEQPVAQYARKVARTLALHTARDAGGYGVLAKGCELAGRQLEEVLNRVTRGFPDAASMLTGIRRRPCAPMLALLRRRLENFDGERLARRARSGEELSEAIGGAVAVVGAGQPERTHWLFAVTVEDPRGLISALYRSGFDATTGATSLTAVGGARHPPPPRVSRMVEQIVFLPAWPEIPADERARLASELRAWVAQRRSSAA